MGGPCYLVQLDGKEIRAPDATDNFQQIPFEYPIGSGEVWYSCEAAYQGSKITDESIRNQIRELKPIEGESLFDFGCRIWGLGQGSQPENWDEIKVDVMWKVNVAKYVAHPQLQADLLATGDFRIVGAPSTWRWKTFNGLIQTMIRKMLQEGIELTSKPSITQAELLALY